VLIVANLDAEANVAGIALPERVLGTISALGTLLRVFASDDDLLWTPRPVDAARVPPVEGLARPRLVSGPLRDHDASPLRLAWAETPDLRRDSRFARVAHRSFGLSLADELGVRLPGARMLGSVEQLRDHLASGGAALAPEGRWVLKAPWSAAGRWRLRDTADDAQVERFFARFGESLFEPWLTRTEDSGVCGEVAEDGTIAVLGSHEQVVDDAGRFRGIGPLRDATPDEASMTERVGQALARARHVGPFGIDTWRGVDRASRPRENLLGEINPRLTMGRVSRELLLLTGGKRLLVGSEIPGGPGITPLLLPGPSDPTTVWLDAT